MKGWDDQKPVPETYSEVIPEKLAVGRFDFPFGKAYFQVRIVSFKGGRYVGL